MRKLAWITVAFTYFLMVWGNLVSATGSGLGCPDWPLCHGTVTPAVDLHVFFEWGHRLLAFTASCLILATMIGVFRSPQTTHSTLRRSGKSLLVLLGIQILLGATTVLLGLSTAVSTIHLIVATLVWSGLITVACTVTWGSPMIAQPSPKVRRLAIAGLIGLLVQFVLGALVRHGHAGLACPRFPLCLEGFLPIPFTFETAIAFFHRWWGILLLGVFVHLALVTAQQCKELARVGRRTLGLACAQVLLGIGTVLSGLDTGARATHAAVGYALWGMLFYIALRSGVGRWLWEPKRP